MTHLVQFREGDDRLTEEYETLEAAIARVESLVNDEGSDARVFSEVPLERHTYVRVAVRRAADPGTVVRPVREDVVVAV